MKPLLKEQASLKKMIYTYENKDYLNTMVAYYGGGVNLSTILDQRSAPKDPFGEKLEVSFLKASLEGKYLPDNAYVKILARCVNLATGFHPFNFICNSPVDSSTPAYFGETPSFEDLRKSRKEGYLYEKDQQNRLERAQPLASRRDGHLVWVLFRRRR
jgi:hypothetical protein